MLAAFLRRFFFGCPHGNTWPVSIRVGKGFAESRQVCPDCGMSRKAVMRSNGWLFGKWENEAPNQTVKEVIHAAD